MYSPPHCGRKEMVSHGFNWNRQCRKGGRGTRWNKHSWGTHQVRLDTGTTGCAWVLNLVHFRHRARKNSSLAQSAFDPGKTPGCSLDVPSRGIACGRRRSARGRLFTSRFWPGSAYRCGPVTGQCTDSTARVCKGERSPHAYPARSHYYRSGLSTISPTWTDTFRLTWKSRSSSWFTRGGLAGRRSGWYWICRAGSQSVRKSVLLIV